MYVCMYIYIYIHTYIHTYNHNTYFQALAFHRCSISLIYPALRSTTLPGRNMARCTRRKRAVPGRACARRLTPADIRTFPWIAGRFHSTLRRFHSIVRRCPSIIRGPPLVISYKDFGVGAVVAEVSQLAGRPESQTASWSAVCRAFLRGGLVDMGFRIFMAGYFWSMSGRQVLKQGVWNVWGWVPVLTLSLPCERCVAVSVSPRCRAWRLADNRATPTLPSSVITAVKA